MFIGFSKRLKSMAGFRIGVGMRLNSWYGIVLMFFFGLFYMCWYGIIGCGWLVYGVCYIYYWIFKAIVNGCKKLIAVIRSRSTSDIEK